MSNEPIILLVEDEHSITDMYEAQFSAMGIVINVVHNMEEADNFFKKQIPDILLLDLIIPSKQGVADPHTRVGFSLLKKIKSNVKTRNVIVIVLTNLDTPLERKEAEKLGAEKYLIKAQLLPKEIVDVVIEVLKKVRAKKKLQ